MNLCKQWLLQCECSVVHSGKSISHALYVEYTSQRNINFELIKHILIERVFNAGCRRPQRHPQYEARQ